MIAACMAATLAIGTPLLRADLTITFDKGGDNTTPNGTEGGLNDDHDNDGVDKGVEFFLGGASDTTGFTPLPGVVNTGGLPLLADGTHGRSLSFILKRIWGRWVAALTDMESGHFPISNFPFKADPNLTAPAMRPLFVALNHGKSL